MRFCEETFGAALVRLSESSRFSQAQRLAVESLATTFGCKQRTIAVLNAALEFPLRRSKKKKKNKHSGSHTICRKFGKLVKN